MQCSSTFSTASTPAVTLSLPTSSRPFLVRVTPPYLSDRTDLSHTGNIAFLIKYTFGPGIQASHVSVSVIDVRGPHNSEIGHKVTVCVHDGPGKFTVVVWKQVRWGQNAVMGLGEKVDKAIKDILAKEGNDGYGDIKG
jgi:hypothetical protein